MPSSRSIVSRGTVDCPITNIWPSRKPLANSSKTPFSIPIRQFCTKSWLGRYSTSTFAVFTGTLFQARFSALMRARTSVGSTGLPSGISSLPCTHREAFSGSFKFSGMGAKFPARATSNSGFKSDSSVKTRSVPR